MKRYTRLSLTFLFFLVSFSSLFSQSKIIEKVNFKNFHGVFEIKNNGYFVCYRKSGKTLLEIYNRDLELISSKPTDYKITSETYFDSRNNGKSFLAIIARSAKKYKINSYDFNGDLIKSIELKKKIDNIYSVKDKGYFFVLAEKKKTIVRFYNNNLEMQWIKVVDTSNSHTDLYTRNLDATLMPSISFTTNIVNSDALYLVLSKTKGMMGKMVNQKIIKISVDGDILYKKEYNPKKRQILNLQEANGKAIIIISEGDFAKVLKMKPSGITVEVLDKKGNIENSYSPELDLLGYSGNGLPKYLTRDFFKRGKEYILVTESITSPKFSIIRYDEEFNEISSDTYNRIACTMDAAEVMGFNKNDATGLMNSTNDYLQTFFHQDFRFTTFTEDGELLIVYFMHGKKSIELKVSSSSTPKNEGKSVGESFEMAKNKDSKVKVKWYNVYPNEYNKAMYSFYNKKKKQIEMYIVEL